MKTKPTEDAKLHSLKILFADDEVPLQELMKNELPRMGHEVTVCPDGNTAAAALERNTYDCILVDLDMPGLNGIEVIERAKDINPDTEAVVLTGKSSLQTAVETLGKVCPGRHKGSFPVNIQRPFTDWPGPGHT